MHPNQCNGNQKIQEIKQGANILPKNLSGTFGCCFLSIHFFHSLHTSFEPQLQTAVLLQLHQISPFFFVCFKLSGLDWQIPFACYSSYLLILNCTSIKLKQKLNNNKWNDANL